MRRRIITTWNLFVQRAITHERSSDVGKTSIEWTATQNADGTWNPGYTFNPWIGCTHVSPGCLHCYAETMMDQRYGRVEWGKGKPRMRTSAANWRKPLTWNKKAASEGIRYRVFCSSLADVFDPEVDDTWRRDLCEVIERTPHLDWLLLTKRPEHVNAMIERATGRYSRAWLANYPNVWIGTSVEDQRRADERIPELLNIPAKVRFLSCEPLLGRVDLGGWIDVCPVCLGSCETAGHYSADDGIGPCDNCNGTGKAESGIHWVIAGGESGHGARPMNVAWARSLRDQCSAAGVPFLFKQWGEHVGGDFTPDSGYYDIQGHASWHKVNGWTPENNLWTNGTVHYFDDHNFAIRVGKHAAGRLLDGREWNEFPA
jgi:protein gp37